MKYVFRAKSESIYADYKYEETDIKTLINENKISEYNKIPLLKVGDFVTCCYSENSINPGAFERETEEDEICWQKGKVIKVTSVVLLSIAYYITGENATGGVYASGVRYATEEEIKDYKSK